MFELPCPSLFRFATAAEVEKQSSYISETATCARYLLPKVQARMATGVSLADAVCLEEAEAMAHFRSYSLTSIKDICSGKDGGLGKAKKARGTAALVTHGEDNTLDDSD
jgi:CO/xanthine dehydrogenase FAD-binding subunit